MTPNLARDSRRSRPYAARYTPRFIAAIRRRYEDTDESMPSIAFGYGISVRTLHRIVEREGWHKRGDRPPKDLMAAELLAQAAEAMARGESGAALMQAYQERKRQEQQEHARAAALAGR